MVGKLISRSSSLIRFYCNIAPTLFTTIPILVMVSMNLNNHISYRIQSCVTYPHTVFAFTYQSHRGSSQSVMLSRHNIYISSSAIICLCQFSSHSRPLQIGKTFVLLITGTPLENQFSSATTATVRHDVVAGDSGLDGIERIIS